MHDAGSTPASQAQPHETAPKLDSFKFEATFFTALDLSSDFVAVPDKTHDWIWQSLCPTPGAKEYWGPDLALFPLRGNISPNEAPVLAAIRWSDVQPAPSLSQEFMPLGGLAFGAVGMIALQHLGYSSNLIACIPLPGRIIRDSNQRLWRAYDLALGARDMTRSSGQLDQLLNTITVAQRSRGAQQASLDEWCRDVRSPAPTESTLYAFIGWLSLLLRAKGQDLDQDD